MLGVIQLAQFHIGLLDGVFLGHVGGLQLGNLRQTLGRGHNGLGQVGCSLLEIIDKIHGSTSLKYGLPFTEPILAYFLPPRKDLMLDLMVFLSLLRGDFRKGPGGFPPGPWS